VMYDNYRILLFVIEKFFSNLCFLLYIKNDFLLLFI
jgi:hypothetical protein